MMMPVEEEKFEEELEEYRHVLRILQNYIDKERYKTISVIQLLKNLSYLYTSWKLNYYNRKGHTPPGDSDYKKYSHSIRNFHA